MQLNIIGKIFNHLRSISRGVGLVFLIAALFLAIVLGARTMIDKKDEHLQKKTEIQAVQPCVFNAYSGPELALLPGGVFMMGAPEGKVNDEQPAHKVSIQAFAMSRCEITRAQFQQFVDATHFVTSAESGDRVCSSLDTWSKNRFTPENNKQAPSLDWRNPGFTQSPQDPVVCVSWADASAYISWLNKSSSGGYRLPSSAEWEYAARAEINLRELGVQQVASVPEQIQKEKPNKDRNQKICDSNIKSTLSRFCEDRHSYTAPVASYKENDFTLFDMKGNVWEWVEDCAHKNYKFAPYDGSPWLLENNGDCSKRLLRGGSWRHSEAVSRSSNLVQKKVFYTSSSVGFRVAKTLSLESGLQRMKKIERISEIASERQRDRQDFEKAESRVRYSNDRAGDKITPSKY